MADQGEMMDVLYHDYSNTLIISVLQPLTTKLTHNTQLTGL